MDILSIDPNNIDLNLLKEIAFRIKKGETAVIPTDTCYGLAANPNIKSSVEKIYQIKNRDIEKQISCIFKDIEQIKEWAELNDAQRKFLTENLPGAFTFVLNPNKNYPLWGETAGVRIPDSNFTMELSNMLNIPYTSTSANLAGAPSCYSIEEFLEQTKNHPVKPDFIVDAGTLPHNEPSTVVDIRTNEIKILREGSGKLKSS